MRTLLSIALLVALAGCGERGTLSGQTVDWNGDAVAVPTDVLPVVRNDVEGYVSYFTSGKIGPEANLPVNPISSNLATDTGPSLR